MNTRPIVVTGTDTDIGKTIFAAALAGALQRRSPTYYWKPVQAGLDPAGTDTMRVAALSGLPVKYVLPEAYRLNTPCSPHLAAELDHVTIDTAKLALPDVQGALVVEGAGGIMVPLSRQETYLDQFARWRAPVVLVARTQLGTINHSLLSIQALRSHAIPIIGVAFVGEAVEDSEAIICAMGNVKRLGRLPLIPTLTQDALAAAFEAHFDWRDFI